MLVLVVGLVLGSTIASLTTLGWIMFWIWLGLVVVGAAWTCFAKEIEKLMPVAFMLYGTFGMVLVWGVSVIVHDHLHLTIGAR